MTQIGVDNPVVHPWPEDPFNLIPLKFDFAYVGNSEVAILGMVMPYACNVKRAWAYATITGDPSITIANDNTSSEAIEIYAATTATNGSNELTVTAEGPTYRGGTLLVTVTSDSGDIFSGSVTLWVKPLPEPGV